MTQLADTWVNLWLQDICCLAATLAMDKYRNAGGRLIALSKRPKPRDCPLCISDAQLWLMA